MKVKSFGTDFHLLISDGPGVKLLLTGLKNSRAPKESSKKSLVAPPVVLKIATRGAGLASRAKI